LHTRPPFNPQSATAEVSKLFKEYGVHTAKGDRYAAGFSVEAFQRCGIRLEYTERDRSAVYSDALPLFTAGRARIVDSRKLVTQFASLERRPSPSGKDRIDHGRDGHDDLCNASALAMVEVASNRGGDFLKLFTPELRRRMAQRASPYGSSELATALRQLRENNR
jgi:hypothetical protein